LIYHGECHLPCSSTSSWRKIKQQTLRVLHGFRRSALLIARLISGSSDRTVRVWDARGGECLEVIGGSGDVRDWRTPLPFPFRAGIARFLETVVERARSGKRVAWFAVPLDRIVTGVRR